MVQNNFCYDIFTLDYENALIFICLGLCLDSLGTMF